MNIEGIPERIERSATIAMIESLGLDPSKLRSVTIGMNWVTVEVMARDELGHVLVDRLGNLVLLHTIQIPVTDPVDAPPAREVPRP